MRMVEEVHHLERNRDIAVAHEDKMTNKAMVETTEDPKKQIST